MIPSTGIPPASNPPSGFRSITEPCAIGILCLAAVIAPLFFGGTGAVARFGIELAIATAIALWATGSVPSRRWLLVPALAAGCFLIQVIPLPSSVLQLLSPFSLNAWRVAQAETFRGLASLSLEPAATCTGIRRLFLALSVIAMTAHLCRQRPFLILLLGAASLSGIIICILGLSIASRRDDRLLLGFYDMSGPIEFWKTPVHEPGQTAAFSYPVTVTAAGHRYTTDDWVVGDRVGPYIVSNHFAGAVVLTAPLIVASWLLLTRDRLPTAVRLATAVVIYGIAAYAVAIRAESRAGTASLCLALLCLPSLTAPNRLIRIACTVLTCLIAAVITAVAAGLYGLTPNAHELFPSALQPRIRAILDDKRAVASHVALRMANASPWFGTGLDTYGGLYPRFARDDQPWYFAHNDYAQFLSEAGVLGILVTLFVCLRRFRSTVSGFLKVSVPDRLATGSAAAAVVGIAAHSLFDWNMHVPANAFLTCLNVGVLASVAPSTAVAAGRLRGCRATAAVFTTIVALCIALLGRDMQSERVAATLRSALASARVAEKQVPEDQLRDAIRKADNMRMWDPTNASLNVLSGQAYLHLATVVQPIDSANACLESAYKAFTLARRHSAICRGLPED